MNDTEGQTKLVQPIMSTLYHLLCNVAAEKGGDE